MGRVQVLSILLRSRSGVTDVYRMRPKARDRGNYGPDFRTNGPGDPFVIRGGPVACVVATLPCLVNDVQET
jgi:hypothetical protein